MCDCTSVSNTMQRMLATKALHNMYHTVTELHLQLHLQELLALVACHQCQAQV